ncbi:hypothetical protein KC350_g43 [Hortaea werneckii]|nr:hypothetical protein KC350_g43 [Hortaea werneckii]
MNVPCKAQAVFARANATVSESKAAEGSSVASLLAGKDQGPGLQLLHRSSRVGSSFSPEPWTHQDRLIFSSRVKA